MLPREVVVAHVSVPMDARMLVRYADGADPAELDAELATLAGHTPGLSVVDRAAIQAADVEQIRLDGWVNYLMIGVLLAFIAVAAANSLVMATGERLRELALLRLVGATPRQVTRRIRWEALAVTGFGILLGLAIAAATLVPFSLAIAQTAIPHLPGQVAAGVLAGAAVLGLGASELPARIALRRDRSRRSAPSHSHPQHAHPLSGPSASVPRQPRRAAQTPARRTRRPRVGDQRSRLPMTASPLQSDPQVSSPRGEFLARRGWARGPTRMLATLNALPGSKATTFPTGKAAARIVKALARR